jgi:hypothetical protein
MEYLIKRHAIKTYRGVAVYLHASPTVYIRWRRVVNFTPRLVYCYRERSVPTESVSGRAAKPVCKVWRREMFSPLP